MRLRFISLYRDRGDLSIITHPMLLIIIDYCSCLLVVYLLIIIDIHCSPVHHHPPSPAVSSVTLCTALYYSILLNICCVNHSPALSFVCKMIAGMTHSHMHIPTIINHLIIHHHHAYLTPSPPSSRPSIILIHHMSSLCFHHTYHHYHYHCRPPNSHRICIALPSALCLLKTSFISCGEPDSFSFFC